MPSDNTTLREWVQDLPLHMAAAAAHNTTGEPNIDIPLIVLARSLKLLHLPSDSLTSEAAWVLTVETCCTQSKTRCN